MESMKTAEETFSKLLAAIELRTSSKSAPENDTDAYSNISNDSLENYTEKAADAYSIISNDFPKMEPLARESMLALSLQVRTDAGKVLNLIKDDPAYPFLENSYYLCISELNLLAAVFFGSGTNSEEYSAVCSLLENLVSSGAEAQPTWRLVRSSRAAARSRPPSRMRKKPSDDREYYL